MASLCKHTNGSRYIKFSSGETPSIAGKSDRPKITLGKVTQKQAETMQRHIEHLCRAKKTGTAIPNTTAEWLESLGEMMWQRLERVGLVSPREAQHRVTLNEWIDQYTASRKDVSASTLRIWGNATRNLNAYFPSPTALDEITTQAAEAFSIWLRTDEGLADNTARKRCSIAKQFFSAAKRARLIQENPFDGITCNVRENPSKFYFVSHAEAMAVLDACPDAQWRLIFSLWRWGGLRQQEVLAVRWEDVLWDTSRLVVHATKTAHHANGGVRILPLFPELETAFQEVFDQAEPGGSPYAITRYREGQNLGALFRKIVISAGITPWPKLCQNLRSTRETELFKLTNGNIKAVCEWIGNSPDVAMRHYAQVTEEDFKDVLAKSQEAFFLAAQKRGQNWEHKGDKIGDRAKPQGEASEGEPMVSIDPLPFVYAAKRIANKKGASHCDSHPVHRVGLEPTTR
jgi:integrase